MIATASPSDNPRFAVLRGGPARGTVIDLRAIAAGQSTLVLLTTEQCRHMERQRMLVYVRREGINVFEFAPARTKSVPLAPSAGTDVSPLPNGGAA